MKRSLFALALAAALPMSAQAADGISYTYFEADYVNADVSDFTSTNGWALRGSAHFGKSWYGIASWTSVNDSVDIGTSVGDLDLEFEQATVGIGWHADMSPNAAFIAEAAWVNDKYHAAFNPLNLSGNDSFDGWRLTAGLRGNLGKRFEGEVRAHWSDLQDIDGGFGGEINGLFKINPTWGITAGWQHDDLGDDADVEQWRVGVRASFN